jgi:hypothetical protein
MDVPNFKNLEPYEKEGFFAEELELMVNRFCKENNMTYAQIIGVLEIIKSNLIEEALNESDDEEDE